jgi:hypothetical protein
MVEDGAIDVLTGDWLAELTMFILARSRDQGRKGYAWSFVDQMEQVLGTCLDLDIKVVSNAGGLDPRGCADALTEVAAKLGLSPKIAYIIGDDLLDRLPQLAGAGLLNDDGGAPVVDASVIVTANAYLGCWGIVEALRRGADVVITGRTTDAAIVCGPAAWHHGWSRTNWDALAGAVVAGHVIECGTQATGGNYSFFEEVPGMSRVGFPWAEIAADGSAVIGKHLGTGGEVSTGTVTSQLLYEIGGPSYLGPDVTACFDTIQLEPIGPDRIRIYGTRGVPPPKTLKVGVSEFAGYRNEVAIALTGIEIESKANLVESAFWAACEHGPDEFESVTTKVSRTDKLDPVTNEEAVAVWRLIAKHKDRDMVGRALSDSVAEIALSTIPGFFSISAGRSGPQPYSRQVSAHIPAELVPQTICVHGEKSIVVESTIPTVEAGNPAEATSVDEPRVITDPGSTVRAPMGLVVGARSGDKGGTANLGVFARTDEAWGWLDQFLTIENVRALLPETASLKVDRYRFPALRALNFVIHRLLEDGVSSSTRQDAQAKGLGEWLRARIVDVPEALL